MKNFFQLFFCIVFILFFQNEKTFSQIIKNDDEQQNLLEQQSQNTDAESDSYEDVEELALTLQLHPLNLDKATEDELKQLVEMGVMNELQMQSLISYRKQFGKFISIFELQAVPYFDLQTIQNILPYIKVSGELSAVNAPWKEIAFDGDYMLLTRLQQAMEVSRGFSAIDTATNDTSRYLGSPQKIYARFRYNYGTKLSYGITAKKDAGEQLFGATQPNGFDYYSAHFYLRGSKWMKAIAIGDYTLSFGQGLVMWGGFGIGKSPQVLGVEKGGRPIKPYTSSNEVNFFRGVAATIGTKKISFTPFFSYKKLDANVSYIDTVSDFIIITSFGGDGYHRTYNELGNQKIALQQTVGGNLNFHTKNFSAGFSAVQNALDVHDVVQRIYPYNQFALNNVVMQNASFDYSWRMRNMQLFGEAAMSGNGGKALLQGLQMSLSPKADLSLVYRNYSRSYLAPFAQAFAESSTPNNEKGLYAGIQIRPARKLTLDAYADLFQHPWLDFQVDAPATGTDYFAQLTFKPTKLISMYVRFRDKEKEVNSTSTESHLDYLIPQHKQNLRFNFSYKVNQLISFQSRVEGVRFSEGATENFSKGILFLQDVNFKKSGVPVALTLRYCIFDTDNFDTRIYAYENDVLYSYSIPSFQGRGSRWYALVRYTINKHFDVWCRFAQTIYLNQTVISNGLDEIQGNHKSELKLEVRARF